LRNYHPFVGYTLYWIFIPWFSSLKIFMYILEKGLSYQRLVLVVQEKPNCPISETGLSIFAGLNPLPRTYPFTIFLTSLSLSRTTVGVTPRPPLAIPWFLRGILEFLGQINSPRTSVSVPPTDFSSSQGIFT
jgi:hypothetical protein